ncbi:sulfurtransferase-like selenium metabolism protein YedF [bacterium 210702-DFI.5.13]|jgi:selenium metabolism protein YedF|nr:sulfurtransferase-like selenium metabolism protein YedF [uncultured Blautia sp.]MCB6589674.1 sulfurtransferase-like selenium metabolism protein YedF [bacterium 210702-DFI.5.13]SCJ38560.1 selenium metabolism protein YedF [uncultured Blautia sp.]
METKTFDARGMACPLPVVNAKKASEEMTNGGTLTVLVDNEIAVQNLTKFGNSKGFTVSSEKKADKDFAVTFQIPENGAAPATAAESAAPTCAPDSKKHGLIAVLSANTMGNGEEQLGKLLMKSFIFALTKQDQLPETILCYNSGAYLTCEGSDSLEDLKSLEAEGVKILTCGTCLDFYNLKEKLAVGGVTNMYEIIEIMENAGTIVRP